MKRRTAPLASILVVVAIAVGAAACSDDSDGNSAGSEVPTSSDGGAPSCPEGTTDDGGLCVADDSRAQEAAETVQSLFESESLGAVVIGVWEDGEPLVVGALGESLTGVPATVDMRHRTGNVGHSMVTTVLLQQVEEGTLSLSDPVSTWFPELPAADEVTVDMLAHSTSGYQQYTIVPEFQAAFYEDPFQEWDIDDLIAYGVGDAPIFEPGTSFQFSDTNILILARVLEEATGQSMDELVQEGVFDPLEMDATTPPANAALREPVLHSYTGERDVWEEATFWDPSWTSWAGGWGSDQDDLRRLIEAVGTGELVSDADHETQLAPTEVGLGTNTDERYYGVGISVVNDWLLTAPGLQGYHASVAYLRDQKLTVVIYFTPTPEYDPTNRSTLLFEPLSAILAPDHAVDLG